MSRPPGGFVQVWGWPIFLAVICAIGLVAALLGDSLLTSALSWIGLGLPLLIIVYCWPMRRWMSLEKVL